MFAFPCWNRDDYMRRHKEDHHFGPEEPKPPVFDEISKIWAQLEYISHNVAMWEQRLAVLEFNAKDRLSELEEQFRAFQEGE